MLRDVVLLGLALLVGVGTIWYASTHKEDLLAESMEEVRAVQRRAAGAVLLAILGELVLLGIIVVTR